ncbi:uncharacterized protein LOC142986307 [Anticarsia gemmatalis]|uniref:uncharacterized protein LOC142986307 n=1 Tax=Anticarsia gemmatalis TaxID=129554 RepID=UPI003F7733B8
MPKKQRCCDTTTKIDAACCKDTACVQQLAAMDKATAELRSRAAKLAKREAERVGLLERAEAAWRDLELGYQRRLRLAEEKEEDIARQIKKSIQERGSYKNACGTLTQQMKERAEEVEQERIKLKAIEKDVCERACTRASLSEEAAKYESTVAGEQCKLIQLERDLQFKEEQARHKLHALDSEAASARALTHETERALRSELSGLREQIVVVSNELLEEDEENGRIKEELEELRQVKLEMIEELEGCKQMCESKMQAQLDELQEKKKHIAKLKENVMECKCKMPVDATVEAKRTPSLAALCRCAPEDRFLESCSCTSLRGSLISNLLADLFGGLQSELGGAGSQMPCQLLKCLEDKHNWDRASAVKTNLRNFFSKLLVGELDIAIATSIENYHAKWVGTSCADEGKMTARPGDDQTAGWEQRALERRAQKLAEQLAEQLFEKRAEELTKRAKEIVTSGPPPCECKDAGHGQTARVLPCLVDQTAPFGNAFTSKIEEQPTETPAMWKRTRQDVSQLKKQIEDLKKDSIKKEDLKLMEQKIAKIVKQATKPNKTLPLSDAKSSFKQKLSKEVVSQVSSIKQAKPININLPSPPQTDDINSKLNIEPMCGSDCSEYGI